jgi:hypothetical protein
VNCAAHEDSVRCLGDVVQFDMQVRIAFQIGAIDANAPGQPTYPGVKLNQQRCGWTGVCSR